jgi:hypothetical protein
LSDDGDDLAAAPTSGSTSGGSGTPAGFLAGVALIAVVASLAGWQVRRRSRLPEEPTAHHPEAQPG